MWKLYNEWKKAKDVFVKPKLYWKFGKWRHDHCLPVWRRGNIIDIAGSTYGENAKCYYVKNTVMIKTGESTWKDFNGKEHACPIYNWVPMHKLPGKLKINYKIWKREYRKKWWNKIIPAEIRFPIWLSFYIFNNDVFWKTKWNEDDIRYEYSPHFTIVFFGLSLSFWVNPIVSEDQIYDHYWEALLKYNYASFKGDLKAVIKNCGRWTSYKPDGVQETYFAVDKNYINPKYHQLYDEACNEYLESLNNESNEF